MTSKAIVRLPAAIVLCAWLAACAGVVQTVTGDYQLYTPNQLSYAASAGEIRTIIQGRAFDMPKAAFDEGVMHQMHNRPAWGSPARYTTQPSDGANQAYYVALVFNPPRTYDGDDACAKREGGGGPSGTGEVRLVAAFCSTVHTLTEVRGSVSGASGTDDRVFASLMQQVMTDLFPSRDRHVGASIQQDN